MVLLTISFSFLWWHLWAHRLSQLACTVTKYCILIERFIRNTILILSTSLEIAWNLHNVDFTRWWQPSIEILVHVDTIASHDFRCTFIRRISCSTPSQRCFIGFRSDNREGHWRTLNSRSCLLKSSLRWLWLGDVVHYQAGSSCSQYRDAAVAMKGCTWSFT